MTTSELSDKGKAACPACIAAERSPTHPVFYSACRGCEIRSVSRAPKHLRDAFYERIVDVAERCAFVEAVAAEFKRQQASGKGGKPG